MFAHSSSASQTVSNSDAKPTTATFRYWASERNVEESEILDLLNGKLDECEDRVSVVHDIQDNNAHFRFAENGFQIINHKSAFVPPTTADKPISFDDQKQVRANYWPELRPVVEKELNARLAIPWNCAVRVSSNGPHLLRGQHSPFHISHCDLAPPGARAFLRAMVPTYFEDTQATDAVPVADRDVFWRLRDEIIAAEDKAIAEGGFSDYKDWHGKNYTGPRWAVVSVWRPLEQVEMDPLALLDPRSLFTAEDFDAEACARGVRKTYKQMFLGNRETPGFSTKTLYNCNIMPHPPPPGQEYRWLWIRDQRADQVIVIKFFDSDGWKDGNWKRVAPATIHSAFSLPQFKGQRPRRSVETRMFVIW